MKYSGLNIEDTTTLDSVYTMLSGFSDKARNQELFDQIVSEELIPSINTNGVNHIRVAQVINKLVETTGCPSGIYKELLIINGDYVKNSGKNIVNVQRRNVVPKEKKVSTLVLDMEAWQAMIDSKSVPPLEGVATIPELYGKGSGNAKTGNKEHNVMIQLRQKPQGMYLSEINKMIEQDPDEFGINHFWTLLRSGQMLPFGWVIITVPIENDSLILLLPHPDFDGDNYPANVPNVRTYRTEKYGVKY